MHVHAHRDALAPQEDLREYLQHLEGLNISEAQKLELLQTLWSIMSAFVDLAFGTDPVQQVLPAKEIETHSQDARSRSSTARQDLL